MPLPTLCGFQRVGCAWLRDGSLGEVTPARAVVDAHTFGIYYCICQERWTMQRKAKLFRNNRSQAVRLPKEFQFKTQEVFIRKEGADVILSPRPSDWSSYFDEELVASDSFMEDVEDLPVQERES